MQDPDGSKCKQEEEGKKEVAMSLSFEFRFCLLKNKREIKKWDVCDSGANYKIRVWIFYHFPSVKNQAEVVEFGSCWWLLFIWVMGLYLTWESVRALCMPEAHRVSDLFRSVKSSAMIELWFITLQRSQQTSLHTFAHPTLSPFSTA